MNEISKHLTELSQTSTEGPNLSPLLILFFTNFSRSGDHAGVADRGDGQRTSPWPAIGRAWVTRGRDCGANTQTLDYTDHGEAASMGLARNLACGGSSGSPTLRLA